jgi:hypothetical protein
MVESNNKLYVMNKEMKMDQSSFSFPKLYESPKKPINH